MKKNPAGKGKEPAGFGDTCNRRAGRYDVLVRTVIVCQDSDRTSHDFTGEMGKRQPSKSSLFKKRSQSAKRGWKTRRLREAGIDPQPSKKTPRFNYEFKEYRIKKIDKKALERIRKLEKRGIAWRARIKYIGSDENGEQDEYVEGTRLTDLHEKNQSEELEADLLERIESPTYSQTVDEISEIVVTVTYPKKMGKKSRKGKIRAKTVKTKRNIKRTIRRRGHRK